MKMYEATLYSKAIGTHYEYFTSLTALEKYLSDFSLFIRGTVSEFKLQEEKFEFNNKLWKVEEKDGNILIIQLQ